MTNDAQSATNGVSLTTQERDDDLIAFPPGIEHRSGLRALIDRRDLQRAFMPLRTSPSDGRDQSCSATRRHATGGSSRFRSRRSRIGRYFSASGSAAVPLSKSISTRDGSPNSHASSSTERPRAILRIESPSRRR